jgi:FkbM family methyltransferase
MLRFLIAKIYDNIYGLFKAVFKRNLKGIGFLLRQVKNDYILDLDGQQMYFNHNVAGCYVRLINGKYTEIETHAFLKRIIEEFSKEMTFIDVGANVGEMILDIARYEKVKFIYAFEPHPECAKACKISAILNGFDHKVVVLQKVLSKDTNIIEFDFNAISPNASAITGFNDKKGVGVYPSTLDNELPDTIQHAILLIDVEGAEPDVLKGGKHFIERKLPLIIFEHNGLSKKYFTLDDIKNILGKNYNIYRLRQDGYLDEDYVNTWNCVAINVNSAFYDLSMTLLKA